MTNRVVAALQAALWIVSQKSTLHPVQKIFFLGKWLDLEDREIRLHPRAFPQMVRVWVRIACTPRPSSGQLPKLLGFLQWHVHPRVGSRPFLAGAYRHERWGTSGLPTPVKILHSFVTVLVRCAEPWKPPAQSKFRLPRGMFVRDVEGSEFFRPSIFVDAAWDKFGYRVGCVVPRRCVRSWAVQNRVTNQQETQLQGLAWAVRLACRFGWHAVTIFTDSMSADYQAVGLRAKKWLKRQMRVLRALVWRLAVSGMVVRFVWVPSALQPADPLSRLFSNHNGSSGAAEIEAWCIYGRLISVPAACSVFGVVLV